jgi:hypothetical protein
MEMTRKQFLTLALTYGAGALTGCGPGECTNGAWDTEISRNHGHLLRIPVADVSAGVDKTYEIRGTADHSHGIVITAAHFAALRRHESFTTTTSITTHTHDVTVSCV